MTTEKKKCVLPESIANYHELWVDEVFALNRLLLGEISKSMRGVTLNFDGETIQIVVYFDSTPNEKDIEAMQDIEGEFIAGHEYMSDLVLEVVPTEVSLSNKVKNWGWVFLRRED